MAERMARRYILVMELLREEVSRNYELRVSVTKAVEQRLVHRGHCDTDVGGELVKCGAYWNWMNEGGDHGGRGAGR